MYKISKPRVGAERIEARTNEDPRIETLFIAFLEPHHRLISVAERDIDHGNLRGVRIAWIRPFLQIIQQLYSVVPTT